MGVRRKIIENSIIQHPAFSEGRSRLQQCFAHTLDTPEPICIVVLGESRTGKSRLIEEVRANHQIVREEEGNIVPSLYIRLTSKPTVKAMVTQLLFSMGDPHYDRGTEVVKTLRLLTLVRNCKTKALFIDEFQHFFDHRKNQINDATDWAKNFVEEAGVALIIAGLPICTEIINKNSQLQGRFLNSIFLPRFSWSNKDSQEDFLSILGAFGEVLGDYFDIPDMENEQTGFRFFVASGGLIGYLAKILRQVVWDCESNNRKMITMEDFSIAYKKSVLDTVLAKNGIFPFGKDPISPNKMTLDIVSKIGVDSELAPKIRKQTRSTI